MLKTPILGTRRIPAASRVVAGALLALLLTAALAGCGQKGPLFLPAPPVQR